MRDIIQFNEAKVKQHYDMYAALVTGLGGELATSNVVGLNGERTVGSQAEFINQLRTSAKKLQPYIKNVSGWLAEKWADEKCGFVFEKAQAIGLDYRWGVYPDITASDTTFDGIFSATEGVIDPDLIKFKAGVIKATYMSSVGTRQLPTIMPEELAHRIREDAYEYGSTTKRPRGIAYLDLPALSFFAKVGRINTLALTHMDVSYEDVPIKICVGYKIGKKPAAYRPDQDYLSQVTPIYEELPSWDVIKLRQAKSYKELPTQAQKFLEFISKKLALPLMMITTGPQREQGLVLQSLS